MEVRIRKSESNCNLEKLNGIQQQKRGMELGLGKAERALAIGELNGQFASEGLRPAADTANAGGVNHRCVERRWTFARSKLPNQDEVNAMSCKPAPSGRKMVVEK